MYRSIWELEALVRYRTAYLSDERQACTRIERGGDRPASLVIQLRHRLGIGLIKAGQALADHDAVRGFATPPARPATWGAGS